MGDGADIFKFDGLWLLTLLNSRSSNVGVVHHSIRVCPYNAGQVASTPSQDGILTQRKSVLLGRGPNLSTLGPGSRVKSIIVGLSREGLPLQEAVPVIYNLALVEGLVLIHLALHEMLHYPCIEVSTCRLRWDVVLLWIIHEGLLE